jgi:hypothetical protein
MNKSRYYLFKVGISFFIIFNLFFLISTYPDPIIFELKKANIPKLINLKDSSFNIKNKTNIKDSFITYSSVKDTLIKKLKNNIFKINNFDTVIHYKSVKDTIIEKILLVGDSQLEGLRQSIYESCIENNYILSASIIWYGSTTKDWATTDTLDYFIKRIKPTFIILVIGLNELFVSDIENRITYINMILSKIKKNNLKYFWIGPAAWTKDKGLINAMHNQIGKLFYPSHKLKLERANDKRHPSRIASKIWFDSVSCYMTRNGILKFTKSKKKIKISKNSPIIILSTQKK